MFNVSFFTLQLANVEARQPHEQANKGHHALGVRPPRHHALGTPPPSSVAATSVALVLPFLLGSGQNLSAQA